MRPVTPATLLRPLVAASLLGLLALALAALLARDVLAHRAATRGIETSASPHLPRLGVNVDLLAADDADLARQLDAAAAAGLTWLRQRVEWARVEAAPGVYDWQALDRLVAATGQRDLDLVITLTAAPGWARATREQAAPLAPPADAATFADFAATFARRYRGRVAAVQPWDSPNLAALAVGEYVPPRRYVDLLRAVYPAVKAAAPEMVVLGGGLAATAEESTRNQSETRYLEWVYRAGGGPYFDALAVKPYGFWSGPDDRRVGNAVLNFSRAVVMRETMTRYGDGAKPVWAVEWGWNALPADWQGRASPWGTDDAALQAERTANAVRRVQAEWPWLAAMSAMQLRPAAPPDDPVWGFALLDGAGRPRPALVALQTVAAQPPALPVNPAPAPLTLARWLALALGAAVAAWGALAAAIRLPWGAAWRAWDGMAARLGDRGEMAALGICTLWLALAPWPVNALALLPLALLVSRRLDLALAGIVLTAPFFLRTFPLAGVNFSLAEALTLVTFSAWAVRRVAEAETPPHPAPHAGREPTPPHPSVSPRRLPPHARGLRAVGDQDPTPPRPARGAGADPTSPLPARGAGADPSPPLPPHAGGLRGVGDQDPTPPLPARGAGADPSPLLPPSPPPARGGTEGGRGGLKGVLPWLGDVARRVGLALKAQLPLDLLDLSVLLLLALGALSPLVALMPGVASREFRLVVLEPVLFYVVLRDTRLGRAGLLRLADALVLAAAGMAVYGFATYLGAGSVAAEGVRRMRGLYGSPNNLALLLGRVLPIALALALWGASRARRLSYGAALAPIVVALFLTFSTGAWLLGLPAALLFLGLVKGRRALAVVVGLIGVAILALLPFARTERVGRLLRLGEAQTLEWRLLLWQSAVDMIGDHPWLGVGLDNFLYEYRETYIRSEALADRNLSHPHNIVLDTWTRLGVLGLVALALGQVAFFASGWRLWRRQTGDLSILSLGLMASMVHFLAHGLLDNSYFLVDLAFIYMLTIGAIRNMARRPSVS